MKRELLLLSPLDIQGNGNSERLNNLPQITQLGSCREGIPTQVSLTPKSQLYYYFPKQGHGIKATGGKEEVGAFLTTCQVRAPGWHRKKKKKSLGLRGREMSPNWVLLLIVCVTLDLSFAPI